MPLRDPLVKTTTSHCQEVSTPYFTFAFFFVGALLVGTPFFGHASPQLFLVAMAIIGLGLFGFVLWQGPKVGLITVLAVLPTAQVGTMLLWTDGQRVPIRLLDLVAAATVLAWLMRRPKLQSVLVDAPSALVLALISVMTVSLILAVPGLTLSQLAYSLFYLIRWVVYAGLFFVAREQVAGEETQDMLFQGLLLATATVAVLGLVQMALFPNLAEIWKSSLDLGFVRSEDLDPHVGRLVSTLLDPNFAGGFLTAGLTVTAWRWATSEYSKMCRVSMSGLLGMIIVALVLTYSRSSQLAALVALVGLLMSTRHRPLARKRLVILLLVMLALLALNPRVISRFYGTLQVQPSPVPVAESHRIPEAKPIVVEPSANARLVSWVDGLKVFRRHPVLGVGFNAYRWHREENRGVSGNGTQNSYITLLATTGLVGMLVFILFAVVVLRRLATRRDEAVVPVAFGSILGVGVHALFIEDLTYPPLLVILWLLLAIGLNSNRVAEVRDANRG